MFTSVLIYIVTALFATGGVSGIVTICWGHYMSLENFRIRSQNLVFTCDSLRSNDVAFSVFHLSLSPKSSNQSTNFKQWRISESRLVLNLVNDRWFDNHFLDLEVTEREPIQSPLLMKCFETGFASCCFKENRAFQMPVKFLIRYSWETIIFFSIS